MIQGETYFRALETGILSQIPTNNTIIAAGGGLPVFNGNLDTLLGLGVLIYLKTSPEELLNRLKSSHNRPLFINNMDHIKGLLEKRSKYYEKAHYVIDISDKSLQEICNEIKRKLNL